MKIDVHNIIEYEIHKKDFYKNRNEKIGAVITNEYCEYEELKYGNSLTEIYIGLNKIREGKEFLEKHLKHMFWVVFGVTLISLIQYFFKENVYNLFFNIGIIVPLVVIMLTIINIKKYWLYLKYAYFKNKV